MVISKYLSFPKVAKIISFVGFLSLVMLVVILQLNSQERVERANEEVEKATTELDNVVRSQIQKCITKYGYDTCHAVVLEYRDACNTDLTYMDLPVCIDGTLDEYVRNYNP